MGLPVNAPVEASYSSAASITVDLTTLGYVADDLVLIHIDNDAVSTAIPISLNKDTVTGSSANDTFTYATGASDVWANGDEVVLVGTMPTTSPANELAAMTRYFVRDVDTTANTFKLETSLGSGTINLTSNGSGLSAYQMKSVTTGWA